MKANKNQPNVIATFMGGVKAARKGGNALTQKAASDIALATIGVMFKDDGTPIKMSAPQTDIFTAMFYPNIETRLRVIRFTLKSAGCTLDETTEELLNRLLNPALLEKKLAKVQTAPPAINWNEMVNEEEHSSSPAGQEEPVTVEEIASAAEDEAGSDDEPPAAAPVTGKKPAGK